jgi:hypothetical protein
VGRKKFDLAEYCDRLREHVAISERVPEVSQTSFRAIDCFEKVMESRSFSEDGIHDIIVAAKSQRLVSYYIGTELLLELINKFPAVEIIWRNMIESPIAHERWVAITAVRDERMPFDLALDLVQKTINDKSSKVRSFAIEDVYTLNLRSLLPELKKRADIEKNTKVMQTIEFVISHME